MIEELASINTARSITLYVFLVCIVVSLLVLFVSYVFEMVCRFVFQTTQIKKSEGWAEERILQKVIGGLSVFVVAIISNSPWVMGLSLFIGGLIIASERFMRALAIIMKSQSQDLPKTIDALTGLESSDASAREIEQKLEQEAKESVSVPPSPAASSSRRSSEESRRRIEERIKVTERAEKAVTKFLLSHFGDRYRAQVKISNQYGTIIADGALYAKADEKELTHVAEIKYVENRGEMEDMLSEVNFWARRTLERFRYLLLSNSVIFAIVGKDFSKETAAELGQKIQEKFAGQIWPSIFNLKDNGDLDPLYPAEISNPHAEEIPSSHLLSQAE